MSKQSEETMTRIENRLITWEQQCTREDKRHFYYNVLREVELLLTNTRRGDVRARAESARDLVLRRLRPMAARGA